MKKTERVNITCGDLAATSIKNCGVSGDVLPWRDLLLIGPLPKLDCYQDFFIKRSEYIKDWTQLNSLPSAEDMARDDLKALENSLSATSIVFWVWPMLSNHTMFLCLLDWYQKNDYQGQLLWVDASEQLGRYDEAYIRTLIDSEKTISQAQLAYAESLWEVIRQPTPEKLVATLRTQAERFPYMNKALWRYLEELPTPDSGLSHLQHKVMEAIDHGCHSPREIYKYAHQDEQYFIAGDWYFWHLIEGMINVDFPLICARGSRGFYFPPRDISQDFDQQHLFLTVEGRQVLAGKQCHISLNGNKRPWGGIDINQLGSWRYCSKSRDVVWID